MNEIIFELIFKVLNKLVMNLRVKCILSPQHPSIFYDFSFYIQNPIFYFFKHIKRKILRSLIINPS